MKSILQNSSNWDSSSFCSDEEEEEEVKLKVRVDSCLLCAQPAVNYDCDGNIIKREDLLTMSEENGKWGNEELFRSLCQILGLEREKRSKQNWKLNLNPFPFCEECKNLMNSVAEVYSKLEELRNLLKRKIEGGEELFSKDNLYETHDKSYLEFRRDAFAGKFIGGGPSVDISGKKAHRSKRSQCQNSQEYKRKLRKPPCHNQEYKYQRSSDDDDGDEVPGKHQYIPSTSPPSQPENLHNSNGTQETLPKTSTSQKLNENDEPLKKKTTRRYSYDKVKVKLGNNKKRLLLRTTFSSANIGFLERDGKTGSITYSTGMGNRFKSKRTTLIFNQVEREGKIDYQCSSCSSHLQMFSCNRKQQKLFRQHFLSQHSTHYVCRLCPISKQIPRHTSKQELLDHLNSVHSIDSMKNYAKRRSARFTRNKRKIQTHPHPLPEESAFLTGEFSPAALETVIDVACPVCGMPFDDRRSQSYKQHLYTHLSEKEKEEKAKYCGRKPKEILTAPPEEQVSSGFITQCQTCGKFITNGEHGLLLHMRDFHEIFTSSSSSSQLLQNTKVLCSLCGVSLADKYVLARHMDTRHPNGEWDGPFKCKFDGCTESLETELNLKIHIKEEHGQSAESTKGILCFKCGKVLASKQTLKQHELVHLGKKPHECHLCKNKFTVKGSLQLHLTIVHGVGTESLKCDEEGCGKMFANRKYFQVHRRTQHGIYLKKGKNRPSLHKS
ncbi:unnamed protein product [Orchesella dallaii]|uniref:C2H2-type domain-containing protein n=1 Tax=Orchesella dallaii TaxID=48710 RepID=A0ABP1RUH1_9HEXA